ncbi:MAG: hypothetical protein R3C69_06835 [Geminicoccaceae bacterium]
MISVCIRSLASFLIALKNKDEISYTAHWNEILAMDESETQAALESSYLFFIFSAGTVLVILGVLLAIHTQDFHWMNRFA